MSKVLVSARDLSIAFGGVQAADGVSLDVHAGEKLAIIGPNGAGKTTFLNICTGYLKPQAGKVWFGEHEITGRAPRAITRLGIARAFQIPQLFLEHTTLENMLIGAAIRERYWAVFKPLAGMAQRDEMLALLEVVGVADAADTPVGELPEGKRKLIDIALALALSPQLLLMDEPTSGVSSQEKFAVMDTLSRVLDQRKVTSVFVEHDMDVVRRYADRVAVWNEGKIQLIGPPAEVFANKSVIETVVGIA